MKSKICFVCLSVFTLFLFFITSCNQKPDLLQPLEDASGSVRIASQPVSDLYSKFKKASFHEVVRFELENGTDQPWIVEAWKDDFFSDDFTAVTGDGQLIPDFGKDQVFALAGTIVNGKGGQVHLVISPEWLEGRVDEGSKSYIVEPSIRHPQARAGSFVVIPADKLSGENPLACGWSELDQSSRMAPEHNGEPVPESANCWKLQLRAHGDYEYYAGTAQGNLNVATYGIAVSMYLGAQRFNTINVDFQLTQIVVFQSKTNPFYYPTKPSMLQMLVEMHDFHDFFVGHPTNAFDGVILFTGKRTVEYGGVARTRGGICKYDGRYSYAIVGTRYASGGNYSSNMVVNITAHEVGHLLGASHTVDINPGSPCLSVPLYTYDLMNTTSGNSSNHSFHECARREMNWHLWFNHACLGSGPCD